ncbi:MAG: PIN domain-containing protein [Nitrososphaerota archaeon]|nr:PIN domain-containing protein [Nitrososphaerota archaeon]
MKAVLDTRFFFALYSPSSSKQETWCKEVILESQKSSKSVSHAYAASCITISELHENMARLVGRDVVRLRISSIRNSGIEFIPIDEEISELAGDLRLNAGELPMADAIIAATAKLFSGSKVLSDDQHFKELKNLKTSWVD